MTLYQNIPVIYKWIVRKGQKVGLVLAKSDTSILPKHSIGWSLTNLKDGDKFSEQTAFQVAWDRADKLAPFEDAPKSLQEEIERMAVRATWYFASNSAVRFSLKKIRKVA